MEEKVNENGLGEIFDSVYGAVPSWVYGGIFLNRKNILIMLMSIELMILAVNLNFLFFSAYLDDLSWANCLLY